MDHFQIWNYLCTPQISEIDLAQIQNHLSSPNPDGRFVIGVIPPVQLVPIGWGLMYQPSPSFGAVHPNYRASNLGLSHDDYHQTSSTDSSSQSTVGSGSHTTNPHIDNGRAGSKRKNSATFPVSDREHAQGSDTSPTSSNVPAPISSDHFGPNPMLGHQFLPVNISQVVPLPVVHMSGNTSSAHEGFHRNVRSRQSDPAHLENSSSLAYQTNILPRHDSSGGNTSGVGMAGYSIHTHACLTSDRTTLLSGSGHVANQSLTGNSVAQSTMETSAPISTTSGSSNQQTRTDRGRTSVQRPVPSYSPPGWFTGFSHVTNPSVTRNNVAHSTMERSAPISTTSGSSNQQTRTDRGRTSIQRPIPIYTPLVWFAPTSLDNDMHSSVQAIASSGHSGPSSTTNHSQDRNRRAQRQHLTNEGNTYWSSQEGAAFVAFDDISYEELLALGERIGSVSTGLSEDAISRCLIDATYWIRYDEEDDKCVICLEEFKDGERLGRLKCRHDFHVSCIREWLLMKCVCPICKADALSDI